jgi:hypothetical protein
LRPTLSDSAAGSVYRELRPEVDELVALMRPEPFYGVFCLRSFFATESAFLAVVFGFNLLGEFQRAVDPTLKTYKQPATLRFEVFTCDAILGRSGHHLILHMSKNWGGYSSRKPLFNSLLHWPPPTSPKFDPSIKNAA